jgi:hypothetical protein
MRGAFYLFTPKHYCLSLVQKWIIKVRRHAAVLCFLTPMKKGDVGADHRSMCNDACGVHHDGWRIGALSIDPYNGRQFDSFDTSVLQSSARVQARHLHFRGAHGPNTIGQCVHAQFLIVRIWWRQSGLDIGEPWVHRWLV